MNGAAKRFINTDITVMEFIVIAALFWSIFTLIVSIGKDVMAALLPMRGIVTTGFLLFGFALTLRPILGQAGVGLGLGVYLLSLLIALVLVVIKGDYKAQRVLQSVLLENDPALQAEFWKGGDLFYFNKKDKRLFVPRPHQIDGGLTANLGHKKVWVMYIAASSIPLTASIVMFIFRVLE
ncbi:MAG: hypothetical protein LBB40_00100 [Holophagales bacterium]|jgi:uncharacterized membrane protein|nr:hypothetical protein [Holophagales bacterium]